MSKLNLAVRYLPELDQLPLIIAGPILCHVQSDEITVWLALKKPDTVTLKVYETQEGNCSALSRMVLQGRRETIALGKNLYVVAVTAVPVADTILTPGRLYAYDLHCQDEDQDLIGAINGQQQYSISYFSHQLPTFCLPPQDLNYLRIVHGSCRKPHGGGKDTLSCLDHLIQDAASDANQRPHQVFLTGDQIYGDDVADPMLWLCQGISQLLFGWSEELPLQCSSIVSDELPPGQRSEIARIEAGMTAMLHGKQDKAKSHLFSFGEYAAAYLLAWSSVFVPQIIPDGASLGKSRQQTKVWQKEIQDLQSFFQDLSTVRRALANVPVYTICDDHDISDDWYLNREWCDRVLGKPLGKRVVQNGLLAYALFQAWGNTPERFVAGTSGAKLFELATRWLQSKGQDLAAKAECDRYLGIPANNSTTAAPQYQQDQGVLVLAREQEAIPWHYQVWGTSHEVIVLDTRTWRGYPTGSECKIDPPMLLSPSAFEQQLAIPLANKPANIEATLVVLPTNLVALGIIDRIQQYELSRNRVFSNDVGDAWNINETAFITLLLNLCQKRDRVIILSGDIHYSCAVRLVHWNHDTYETSVIVQLTSSAIKNSELATRIVHTKLKSLLPESTERWLGWNKSLKQVKLPQSKWWQKKSLNQKNSAPDWQYRIEWIKRQPAKSLSWRQARKTEPKLNLVDQIFNWLTRIFWRNRWLQEGSEVIGRNNLSLVRFCWSKNKTVIQETYWHPPWKETGMVKSSYEVFLDDKVDRRFIS